MRIGNASTHGPNPQVHLHRHKRGHIIVPGLIPAVTTHVLQKPSFWVHVMGPCPVHPRLRVSLKL